MYCLKTSLIDHSGGIYLCMNVSGDVCDEVVSRSLMSKPAAFLSKLTSVKMNKHLCDVNAFVFFLTLQSGSKSKMCPSGALDPAKLPQRESKNDFVDLVSRSHEADDGVWVGHNKALDRTMSATRSRTVNGNAISDIDGQSDRVDVANEVSLRKVNVSAVPLLKTSYLCLESFSKRPDVQSCVKECARGVRDRTQRATRICRYFLCSPLFGAIEEIKSLLVAYGVPYGFLDLDCDPRSIEKNGNTLWKSKTTIWKVLMGVFETKTFESDTRSSIGCGAVEKHTSDLLAVGERNVDLKIFSPAEIAGVARRLLVMELKRSVFNELHEYLEQSFFAEIAIVLKRLRTVKEIKGNMRNSQTAEHVEKSENEESQVGKVGECEFNVLKFLRATDLMFFECGRLSLTRYVRPRGHA